MNPILEGDAVFLFSRSSAAAFKFPRELASRELMEKLNEKHRWGGGGTQTAMYTHAEFKFLEPINQDVPGRRCRQSVRINAHGDRIVLGDLIICAL